MKSKIFSVVFSLTAASVTIGVIASGSVTKAADFGKLLGKWRLTQGTERCDTALTLAQSDEDKLDLPGAYYLPTQITLGKFNDKKDNRVNKVLAKIVSTGLYYRWDWGEYCAASFVSVRSCMYWGISEIVFSLQSDKQLAIKRTEVSSGNSNSVQVCSYTRVL